MLHVITRIDGQDILVLKVADLEEGGHALIEGARYHRLGHVRKTVSVRDGFTVHEWFAVGAGDLFQVRAGTRRGAVKLLLECYGMSEVRDTATIPALF